MLHVNVKNMGCGT